MADDTKERFINPYTDFPKALQDRIFQKLFEQAEIAKYSDAERRQYEASQKEYWIIPVRWRLLNVRESKRVFSKVFSKRRLILYKE